MNILALGTLSIFGFWVSLLILLTSWPRDPKWSISQHSAKQRQSFLFFSVVQTITSVVGFFLVKELIIRTLGLPSVYLFVYGVLAFCHLTSTWLPDKRKGRISAIHLNLANTMALLIGVFTFMLLVAPGLPFGPRTVAVMVFAYMLVSTVTFFAKRSTHNYLYFQLIYVVSFQALILLIAHAIN